MKVAKVIMAIALLGAMLTTLGTTCECRVGAPSTMKCPMCGGDGESICVWCGGDGHSYSFLQGKEVTCSYCNGLGKLKCSYCNGTGRVPVE